MQVTISTKCFPPEEGTQYNNGFHTLDYGDMESVNQRITVLSKQPLEELEITFNAKDDNNRAKNLIKLQRGGTPIDLSPLEEIPTFTSLKMERVDFSSQTTLFDSIKKMHLTSLTLMGCFLNDDFLNEFSAFLKSSIHLKEINLSSNPFTPAGCRSLIEALEKSSTIEKVMLLQVLTADDDTLNGWPDLLKKTTTLKVVIIGIAISKGRSWVAPLSQALRENKTLRTLILDTVINSQTELLESSEVKSIYDAALTNKELRCEVNNFLIKLQ